MYPLREKFNRTETQVGIYDVQTSAPLNPVDGMVALSDGVSWDPLLLGRPELVKYNELAAAWSTLDGLFVHSATVTSAQLLALNATPKIIAGGVAGHWWMPVFTWLFLDFNAAAYDGIAAGEDLALRNDDDSGAILQTIETTGFLDASADATRYAINSGLITPVAAADLVLHLLTDEIATGDSPLYVRCYARLLPVT